MNAPVFVAGVGIISAIGHNVAACMSAMEAEQAGIGEITELETVHRHELPAAEVKLTNSELAHLSGLPDHYSRTALLSTIAAREAMDDASIQDRDSWRMGFVSANTVGGMDKTESFFPRFSFKSAKRQAPRCYTS